MFFHSLIDAFKAAFIQTIFSLAFLMKTRFETTLFLVF